MQRVIPDPEKRTQFPKDGATNKVYTGGRHGRECSHFRDYPLKRGVTGQRVCMTRLRTILKGSAYVYECGYMSRIYAEKERRESKRK